MALFKTQKSKRQEEKVAFKERQKKYSNYRPGQNNNIKSGKKRRGPDPRWDKWAGPVAGFGAALAIDIVIQTIAWGLNMMPHWVHNDGVDISWFHGYGLFPLYFIIFLLVGSSISFYAYRKFHAVWFNNNANFISDDMDEHDDDAFIRTSDDVAAELDVAPDTGLGYDGHASTLMSHWMMSNKGIKKVSMPQYDKNVDGYVKTDDDGKIVKKLVPMFDKEFADELYSMSHVPQEYRKFYDARDYEYNRKLTRKEGGGKDKDGKYKRAGAYSRKEYDTLADYINHEFYPIDTDTQRPAGVYFYDSRPVNTILIAITRGGKGQTYIEPAFDLWSREKNPWNLFTTDPKGELLAKFYYPFVKRGFEIVQFNLSHPELTNKYNPLINAVQAYRQEDYTTGDQFIDQIVDDLYPNDNGEIWNPAAGNMLRRLVDGLIAHYIDQEKYIRHLGYVRDIPQEIIDQEIDHLYSKVTMYNMYALIGELVATKSSDTKFINVDKSQPPVNEKDYLTLFFDAMKVLPNNPLRQKAIDANNAIEPIGSAEQTIAGIYATLLTNLSIYGDETARALMSGGPKESFDLAGLGFPRRIGIQLDPQYVEKFKLANEIYRWSAYKDSHFTQAYDDPNNSDPQYGQEAKVSKSGWSWDIFKGIFDQNIVYLKMEIMTGNTVAETLYFKFTKGYTKYDDVTFARNPITHKKVVDGGIIEEFDPETQTIKKKTFTHKQFNLLQNEYADTKTPIVIANQVFYSEKPKAIFAVTPPHLGVYQKHVLTIITQILNANYSKTYTTKRDRKPVVGTRMMFEEFGNIRSGKKGIPDIDRTASIALSSNIQLTFVLQSFQQLTAVYDKDIEAILRANSSNTIFLKSNDEDLINSLIKLSGKRHKVQTKNKSISRKMGDLVTTGEPVINYSSEDSEVSTLSENDLLFLAGPQPGNAITFSTGEMPIVNKLDTIMPMAAGLHKRLPQPKGGQYSDTTLPVSSSIQIHNSQINAKELVEEMVGQAQIYQTLVKPKIDALAKKENMTLDDRDSDGLVSDLTMNTVLEFYDNKTGKTRNSLGSTDKPYWKLAQDMWNWADTLSDTSLSQDERMVAVKKLKEELVRCTMDDNLKDLTILYRDKLVKDDKEVNVGYDVYAVTAFLKALRQTYPKPKNRTTTKQNVYEQAKKLSNYHQKDPNAVSDFDILDPNDIQALDQYFQDVIVNDDDVVNGVNLKETKNGYKAEVDGLVIWKCTMTDDGEITNTDVIIDKNRTDELNDAVSNNAALLHAVRVIEDDPEFDN